MKIQARTPTRALVLGASLALGAAAPALAEHEAPRLGLTPVGENGSFFDLRLEPGETASLRLELASFGDEDVHARTYAADAYSLINGGFGARLFGDPASGAATWLDYPGQEFPLSPEDAAVVAFSVTVPVGTLPGDYIAGIVAENVTPYRGQSGSVAVEQVNRVALAVTINVPGRRTASLEIGAVSHHVAPDVSFLAFEVGNVGNVHLKPRGSYTLRDATGTTVVEAAAVMDSVYAGSETLFETPLANALPPGGYCAELALKDEETGAADATDCLPFMVEEAAQPSDVSDANLEATPIVQPAIDAIIGNALPIGFLGVVALAVLGAAWLVWIRQRRRRSHQAA